MTVQVQTTTGAHGDEVVRSVRERYSQIAVTSGSCCSGSGGCGSAEALAREVGYDPAELEAASGTNLGLGCGAPLRHLALQPGETVLDLGSGPGLDAFIAARQVGPRGRVIGVDMTPAMLSRARQAAEKLGLTQVEFREGRLEDLPLRDASVDAVTSNCVINLVPDKAAAFREIARVLKPGGRLVISDIVLAAPLPEALSRDVLAYVGCVAGAALRERYLEQLREAGLSVVEVLEDTDYVAKLMQAAPEELAAIARSAGIDPASLAGQVRSITYRARKQAAQNCCAPSCCSPA